MLAKRTQGLVVNTQTITLYALAEQKQSRPTDEALQFVNQRIFLCDSK